MWKKICLVRFAESDDVIDKFNGIINFIKFLKFIEYKIWQQYTSMSYNDILFCIVVKFSL